MSHYSVAVFSYYDNDFDRLLAPYSEEDEAYFKPEEVDQDYYRSLYDSNRLFEHYSSFEEWLVNSEGALKGDDGKYYFMRNPDAKWDWYTIDGQDGTVELKPGVTSTDRYRKNDYNWFHLDQEQLKSAESFWDKYVTGTEETKKNYIFELYKPEYYLKKYKTKENYLNSYRYHTLPYAYVTPDGKWHAPGNVGWFGLDDATAESEKKYFEEFVQYLNSPENPYVSLVDCHI